MVQALLTLAAAKVHLRVTAADGSVDDADIQRDVTSATEWVERIVETPIIDRQRVIDVDAPTDTRQLLPVPFRDNYGVSTITISRVQYWTSEANPGDAPDGEVVPGRISFPSEGSGQTKSYLWPPADGWPIGHTETGFVLTVDLSTPADNIPEAWKSAALLIVDDLYGQRGDMPSPMIQQRAEALLEQWRPWRG